jgi:hypothetical protein
LFEIASKHDMLVGTQHGGKSNVEIIMFNGHVVGYAAVLEKMFFRPGCTR